MVQIAILLILIFLLYRQPIFSLKTDRAKKNKIAVIKCVLPGTVNFNYGNIKDCGVAHREFKNNSLCKNSCMGLYSCINICSRQAIGKQLDVDSQKCNGCGDCIEVCPVNIIELVDSKSGEIYISCNTSLKAEEMEEYCPEGCIQCYICINVCPTGAIDLTGEGLPVIDYKKCTGCEVCVRKCPPGVIKTVV